VPQHAKASAAEAARGSVPAGPGGRYRVRPLTVSRCSDPRCPVSWYAASRAQCIASRSVSAASRTTTATFVPRVNTLTDSGEIGCDGVLVVRPVLRQRAAMAGKPGALAPATQPVGSAARQRSGGCDPLWVTAGDGARACGPGGPQAAASACSSRPGRPKGRAQAASLTGAAGGVATTTRGAGPDGARSPASPHGPAGAPATAASVRSGRGWVACARSNTEVQCAYRSSHGPAHGSAGAPLRGAV